MPRSPHPPHFPFRPKLDLVASVCVCGCVWCRGMCSLIWTSCWKQLSSTFHLAAAHTPSNRCRSVCLSLVRSASQPATSQRDSQERERECVRVRERVLTVVGHILFPKYGTNGTYNSHDASQFLSTKWTSVWQLLLHTPQTTTDDLGVYVCVLSPPPCWPLRPIIHHRLSDADVPEERHSDASPCCLKLLHKAQIHQRAEDKDTHWRKTHTHTHTLNPLKPSISTRVTVRTRDASRLEHPHRCLCSVAVLLHVMSPCGSSRLKNKASCNQRGSIASCRM